MTSARSADSARAADHVLGGLPDRRRAERHDLASRLELREEEHVVDQLADLLDLPPGSVDQLQRILARKRSRLEQREESRERRPELVRDRGREAGAQLVVRGVLRRLAQVEERLALAERVVGNLDRPSGVAGFVGQSLPELEVRQRLAGAAARGDDAALTVEHDHDLAALLDRRASTGRFECHGHRFGLYRFVPVEEAPLHHLVTSSSPTVHPA